MTFIFIGLCCIKTLTLTQAQWLVFMQCSNHKSVVEKSYLLLLAYPFQSISYFVMLFLYPFRPVFRNMDFHCKFYCVILHNCTSFSNCTFCSVI